MTLVATFFHALGRRNAPFRAGSVALLFLLTALAAGAQHVTLNLTAAPIETAFKEIEKQTTFRFVYTREHVRSAKSVTVSATQQPLRSVLDRCFEGQPLTYQLEDSYIIVREKKTDITRSETYPVKVVVTDDSGIPLPGAAINLKPSGKTYACDDRGAFSFTGTEKGTIILISNIGFETRQFTVTGPLDITVALTPATNSLDETLVIAYGTTTRRTSTGTVEKVSKEELEKQPVPNVLAALHGRVPGLTVQQQNGVPGSAVKIQLRGRTSINNNISNDPLIIIDGVPFAPNNAPVNQVGSAAGSAGLSPFSAINMADIESIEVLKDADATAIYGSRGANGVILITTKKGKAGKTSVEASFRTGYSRITGTMPFMNTREYVAMRKEAFAADGLTPSAVAGNPGYAPDLLIWDSTRFTDLQDLLIGGTAMLSDAQVRISGGTAGTRYSLATGYQRQTTVFPGDMYNSKVSFHSSLSHQSQDRRFSLDLKTSMVFDNNNITASDLTGNLRLPPNLPDLYDAEGKLNWQHGGATFENPMAYLEREYNAGTSNLLSGLQLGYRLAKGLQLRASLGYNALVVKDRSITPIAAQNPATAPLGSANFGTTDYRSFIVEPQLEYRRTISGLKVNILAGTSWQQTDRENLFLLGTGYTSDALIRSLRGAGAVVVVRSDESRYRYAAAFARINLNLRDRYILNLTGRRDGSSRFGPGRRYANFGAAGLAWVFSKESFITSALPALSFGKLRASYGTTGNDKIGDYAYLNTYSSAGVNYQGIPGITPTTLFNPDYAWELNRKAELALEVGFFKDRLQFTAAYYGNLSSNQLINYALPAQTGGQSIIRNFPATVINSGLELELNGTIISWKKMEWTASFNITLPRNELHDFPSFEGSSYFSTLVIGQPLNIAGGYRFAGVNTQTGVYEFYDKDGKITSAPKSADRVKDLVKLDPAFYGGFSSNLKLGEWSLDFFFEYRKQVGQTGFGNVYANSTYPGMMYNMPAGFREHWRSPGDQAPVGRYTTGSAGAVYASSSLLSLNGSDALYGDASYVRLKNLSLQFDLPAKMLAKIRSQAAQIYLQAQNLLTITSYDGGDPESQNLFTLPPLRTLSAGVRITF